MFEELPETYHSKSRKKKKAFLGSAIVHVGLVASLIVAQMVMPEKLGGLEMLTTIYMAPPPPPPLGLAPEAVREVAKTGPKAEARPREAAPIREVPTAPPEKPVLTAPTRIPADVARIIDAEPGEGAGEVIGGIPGGRPGGMPGGILGGELGGVIGGAGDIPMPSKPKEPIRVGGDIREPKLVKFVKPEYPAAAKRSRVEGIVVLEATVTEKGDVEKVTVVSGPHALVSAAVAAVEQWHYEPTVLNGVPLPVILTARVNFSLTGPAR